MSEPDGDRLDLFPQPRAPYIIVAPRYTRLSAGVKVLHMLCHALNMVGQRAYMVICSPSMGLASNLLNQDLLTPHLTSERLRQYVRQGLAPIVIYPETVHGNPMRAAVVVRYFLNRPGVLGGDKQFDPNELTYGYTRRLSEDIGAGSDRVLFLPVCNPNEFSPPIDAGVRHGSCFYAFKYKNRYGGSTQAITEGSIEITRDRPDSQSRAEILDLFRRCELFYAYEDTALILEAILCGCPAVLLPNPYFENPMGVDDMGTDGLALNASSEEIARAKATVHRARNNYRRIIDNFAAQLDRFVGHTQAVAAEADAKTSRLTRNIWIPLVWDALTRAFHR